MLDNIMLLIGSLVSFVVSSQLLSKDRMARIKEKRDLTTRQIHNSILISRIIGLLLISNGIFFIIAFLWFISS